MEEKIDLVVPYVDCEDIEGQKIFEQYNPIKSSEEEINAKNRFRGQGEFFRFFFRAVAKNLPGINTIHLLVQSPSQIPLGLNTDKIHIVYHKDFIPQEYLPTFNSCTIEMFLHNIPDLSDKFLYFNDDVYVLKKLSPQDFFENEKVKFNTSYTEGDKSMYLTQVKNGNNLIFNLNKESNRILILPHSLRVFIKTQIIDCFNSNKKAILQSISPFREMKNFNCYIGGFDLINKDRHIKSTGKNKTISYRTSDSNIKKSLNDYEVICINDTSSDIDIYKNKTLVSGFKNNYSSYCKYEKEYVNKVPVESSMITEQLKVTEEKIKELPKIEKIYGKSNRCFGVISYLSEKINERVADALKIERRLKQLSNLGPNIDILIFARNGKSFKPDGIKSNGNILKYEDSFSEDLCKDDFINKTNYNSMILLEENNLLDNLQIGNIEKYIKDTKGKVGNKDIYKITSVKPFTIEPEKTTPTYITLHSSDTSSIVLVKK